MSAEISASPSTKHWKKSSVSNAIDNFLMDDIIFRPTITETDVSRSARSRSWKDRSRMKSQDSATALEETSTLPRNAPEEHDVRYSRSVSKIEHVNGSAGIPAPQEQKQKPPKHIPYNTSRYRKYISEMPRIHEELEELPIRIPRKNRARRISGRLAAKKQSSTEESKFPGAVERESSDYTENSELRASYEMIGPASTKKTTRWGHALMRTAERLVTKATTQFLGPPDPGRPSRHHVKFVTGDHRDFDEERLPERENEQVKNYRGRKAPFVKTASIQAGLHHVPVTSGMMGLEHEENDQEYLRKSPPQRARRLPSQVRNSERKALLKLKDRHSRTYHETTVHQDHHPLAVENKRYVDQHKLQPMYKHYLNSKPAHIPSDTSPHRT